MNLALICFVLAATVAGQVIAWAWAVGEVNRAFEMRWKEEKDLKLKTLELEEMAKRLEELETLLALHNISRRIPRAPGGGG